MVSINSKQSRLLLAIFIVALATSGCTKFFNTNQANTQRPNSDITVETKPQPGQVAVLNSNIIITAPLSNQKISSPVKVFGRAKATSEANQVAIVLKDRQGFILATTSVAVLADPTGWTSYEATLAYPAPNISTGVLEVSLQPSTATEDSISLPLEFADVRNPIIKLYFSNIIKDPNLLDCASVHPVERQIAYSNNILASTLSALFDGPTEEEAKQGFINNFPDSSVVLNNITLASSTLTLDFNQALQQGVAGSCRVTAIRAQIEQTMKQFGGVNGVIISIDGATEGVLQP